MSNNFIENFENLDYLSQLTILKIFNNKIKLIKEWRGLNCLKILNLSNNLIWKGLRKIKNLSNVTHLFIKGNPIWKMIHALEIVSKNSTIEFNTDLNIKRLMPNLVYIDTSTSEENTSIVSRVSPKSNIRRRYHN